MAAPLKTEKNDLPRDCPWEEPLLLIQFTSPQFQASLLDLWDDIGVFWAGRRTLYLLPSHMITSDTQLDH